MCNVAAVGGGRIERRTQESVVALKWRQNSRRRTEQSVVAA